MKENTTDVSELVSSEDGGAGILKGLYRLTDNMAGIPGTETRRLCCFGGHCRVEKQLGPQSKQVRIETMYASALYGSSLIRVESEGPLLRDHALSKSALPRYQCF
jgi:hypothetical protein